MTAAGGWVGALLLAVFVLVASPAHAAKISFSEKGFIDVGGFVQAQYRATQAAAGDGHSFSNDFLLRRAHKERSGQTGADGKAISPNQWQLTVQAQASF